MLPLGVGLKVPVLLVPPAESVDAVLFIPPESFDCVRFTRRDLLALPELGLSLATAVLSSEKALAHRNLRVVCDSWSCTSEGLGQ